MRQAFLRYLMVNGLNEIPGFRCVMPGGAFYAFDSSSVLQIWEIGSKNPLTAHPFANPGDPF